MIAAVDIDGFWGLVERSAHETDTRQARVAWLTDRLSGLSAEEVVDFEVALMKRSSVQRCRYLAFPVMSCRRNSSVSLTLSPGLSAMTQGKIDRSCRRMKASPPALHCSKSTGRRRLLGGVKGSQVFPETIQRAWQSGSWPPSTSSCPR